MSDFALRVEHLSKRYRIGLQEELHDTMAGAVLDWIKRPAKNIRRLRSLTQFGNSDGATDIIWALKDLSFEVKVGEVLGIIGRNGAGKSTLLKILARITYPTSGRVELRGRISSLLEVGTGFHPELSGRENIYLNGTILGMTKREIDQKFDEIVDFSGVEKFIDTPVKRYSSGMRVRLAFSVAAHLEPEILLVDEVLAVGDAEFQRRSLGKMDEVARGGRTVLFVSHQMAAIRNLCSRAIWIEAGELVASGETDDTVNSYESRMLLEAGSLRETSVSIAGQAVLTHVSAVGTIRSDAGQYSLHIRIQGIAPEPVDRIGVGIEICTLEGVRVFRVGPNLARSWLENLHEHWSCDFLFKDITNHLAGGEYLIHLNFIHPNPVQVHHLENVSQVEVPLVDAYDSGIYFQRYRHGISPLPFEFIRESLNTKNLSEK